MREVSHVFDLPFNSSVPRPGCSTIKVKWEPPSEGWVKLNSDGSVKSGSQAVCGGLIRNMHGTFMAEFSCNLGTCTIMQAELRCILHGVALARNKGVRNLLIEADYSSAILMLDNGCDAVHPCAPLLHDIKRVLSEFDCVKWSHVFREANYCADRPADYGHSLDWGTHYFEQIPPFISLALFSNISGTLFDRVV